VDEAEIPVGVVDLDEVEMPIRFGTSKRRT
jgi:hypothetical protein